MQKLQYAVVLHNQGELDQAEEIYRQVLAVDKHNFYALNFCGSICRVKKRFEEGIDLLSRAKSLQPGNSDVVYNLGNIFKDAGQWDDAISCYEEVLILNAEFPEALNNLGICLNELKRYGHSEIVLRRAVTMQPGFAGAWLNLGIALQQQEKFEESASSYRMAIELKPDFADAYLNLGYVLKEKGDLEESTEFLLSAVKLDPLQRTGFYQLFDLLFDSASSTETLLLNNLSSAICRSIGAGEIICFGDSHVGVFDGIPGFEKVWVGAATAYNLIKSQSSTRGREKIFRRLESAIPGSSAVVLSFGEVDCRSNILKYCIKSDKSIDEVSAEIVSRYFEFVGEITSRGFAVVLCGPYGSGSDHNNQGNSQERYYASVCIERMLRHGAKELGVPYFSLHGVLSDAASQGTRLEFFDDGLHFHGHSTDEISSEVKCMVLSRMLEAINESHYLGVSASPPVVKEISLIGESCLCLLDVFTAKKPIFHHLGLLPDANARVEALSQASKSIVVDLGACLNVEVLKASFSASSVEGVEIWGLDNNGDKADAVINIASCLEKVLSGVRIDAAFPQRSMLRYLVVTCPEGLLSTLSDFDVRGQSFVFS